MRTDRPPVAKGDRGTRPASSVLRAALALCALALLPGAQAHAAQSYDNCTGFIDSLPASIATQGTWCLRKHLYTSFAGGPAITVLADNVTVDCNDHRISGLGAGKATEATGISTGPSRSNATVRNCRIQGFKYGVVLHGNYHLIERNRFEGNTFIGIHASGSGLVIRQNLVAATGGRPGSMVAKGIDAGEGKVLDNTVAGVSPGEPSTHYPVGIQLRRGLAQGNRISGLVQTGGGQATGLHMTGASIALRNSIVQATPTPGDAIVGAGPATSICRQNDVQGYFPAPTAVNCLLYENTDQAELP